MCARNFSAARPGYAPARPPAVRPGYAPGHPGYARPTYAPARPYYAPAQSRVVYARSPYYVRPYSGVFVYGPRPVYHSTYYVNGDRPDTSVQVKEKHLPDRKVDRDDSFASRNSFSSASCGPLRLSRNHAAVLPLPTPSLLMPVISGIVTTAHKHHRGDGDGECIVETWKLFTSFNIRWIEPTYASR